MKGMPPIYKRRPTKAIYTSMCIKMLYKIYNLVKIGINPMHRTLYTIKMMVVSFPPNYPHQTKWNQNPLLSPPFVHCSSSPTMIKSIAPERKNNQ